MVYLGGRVGVGASGQTSIFIVCPSCVLQFFIPSTPSKERNETCYFPKMLMPVPDISRDCRPDRISKFIEGPIVQQGDEDYYGTTREEGSGTLEKETSVDKRFSAINGLDPW